MNHWLALFRARWAALALREQRAVWLAVGVVLAGLLWALLLGPALRVLRSAPADLERVSDALDHMQRLQRRARSLQAQATIPAAVLLKQLQDSVPQLGAGASLQVLGDQATLTLRQVSAAALAGWLADGGQRMRPSEVHLLRDPAGAQPAWNGTLVFRLPPANPGPG